MFIGVTEQGDASLNFDWVTTPYRANVVISKNLTDRLIDALVSRRDVVIFHLTCTGFGGTILEPNIPSVPVSVAQLRKLLKAGFPASQVVLRVDPVIPTAKGVSTAIKTAKAFKGLGVTRLRYSFIDMYPHVVDRFKAADVPLPFTGFSSSDATRHSAAIKLHVELPEWALESCVENNRDAIGCVSVKDVRLLGLGDDVEIGGYQRKGCLCAAGKKELLHGKERCQYGCLYCYWRDRVDKNKSGE